MKKELTKEENIIWFNASILITAFLGLFSFLTKLSILGLLTAIMSVVSGLFFYDVYRKNKMHNRVRENGVRVKAKIIDYTLITFPIPYLKIKCQYFNQDRSKLYIFCEGSYLNCLSVNFYRCFARQNCIDVAYDPDKQSEYYIFIEESVAMWNRSI